MDSTVIWGLGGIVVTISVWLLDRKFRQGKPLIPGVHKRGQKAPLDDPKYILGIRADEKFGFHPYYLERDFDPVIKKKIDKYESLIITGPALAGKTRAVYEALKEFDPQPVVIIPAIEEIRKEKYPDDTHINKNSRTILLFDDIHKYNVRTSFGHYLKQYKDKGAIVIATCRSGDEYKRFCDEFESAEDIFGKPIKIEKVKKKQAAKVADKTGRKVPKSFDGIIGTMFVPLEAMEKIYLEAAPDEIALLQSLKCLYDAGVYKGGEEFSIERLRTVLAGMEEIEKNDDAWHDLYRGLEQKGFYKIIDSNLKIEETYLQNIIRGTFNSPEILRDLAELFRNDFVALFSIAYRSGDLGNISLQKADYEKLSIELYKQCLLLKSGKKFAEDHAMTQNNLGLAYGTLADVDDKASNCRAAISAYENALKVYTFESFPMQYGATQNNLGNAYSTLAAVEDKASNCRAAISAFGEALKVCTLERFPMDYAMTQNNLGNAYQTQAEVEDKVANCRFAISAYENALKVYTLESFPMDYAMTQNNLGAAYQTLAAVEEPAANCRAAISAYENALNVYTLESFPMQYGATQNNLGNAYITLPAVEDKASNCRAAISAYENALKVYTLESFPMDYAMTQNNLGIAYSTLAEVDEKASNCRAAIAAYGEALKVYTLERFPMDYGMTQNNLGAAFQTLAEVEEPASNCRAAISAYENALKVRTLESFPMDYAMTQYNLAGLFHSMAQSDDKSTNCAEAITAINEALKVYTKDELPQDHEDAIQLKEAIRAFCQSVE